MILNLFIVLTVLLVGAALWLPTLRNRPTWRAMITPLASIIGSGFLILGPILSNSFGGYAPAVMLALCAVAWGFGSSIRYNINVIGDTLDVGEGGFFESLSSAVLGFAFTVSVAYYLNLFGAFGLSLTPFDSEFNARLLTTAAYMLIAVTGFTKGFAMLERMEYTSVAVKLAIIAGLLVGLAQFNFAQASEGTLQFAPTGEHGWAALTLAFGLIVTVQGFETSRYLGKSYDAPTRIMSMRWAQMLSTAIYIIYIAFVAYSFDPADVSLDETAIVDMMGIVAPILPILLVAAALAAQFSAAVADTGGSGGLIAELTRGKVTHKQAYALVVIIGLGLTWFADVFQIIAYASRAFAVYYALQAGIAAGRAWRTGDKGRAAFFAALALLGAVIAIFGKPVD